MIGPGNRRGWVDLALGDPKGDRIAVRVEIVVVDDLLSGVSSPQRHWCRTQLGEDRLAHPLGHLDKVWGLVGEHRGKTPDSRQWLADIRQSTPLSNEQKAPPFRGVIPLRAKAAAGAWM